MAAKTVGQTLQSHADLREAIQFFKKRVGLRLARRNRRAEAGQDHELIRGAPLRNGGGLQVCVEIDRGCLGQMRGEHSFGVSGGELLARRRRTRLHEHRPALRRPRQVERSRDLEELALVVDCANARRIEVASCRDVVGDGVVGPTVPQPRDDFEELMCSRVALRMFDLLVLTEIRTGAPHP